MDRHSDNFASSENMESGTPLKPDANTSSESAEVRTVTHNLSRPDVRREHVDYSGMLSGLVWFLATVGLLLAAWFLGPLAIERYQYAATKGRVTAEYENARKMLEGVPLEDVSLAYQLVAQRIKPSVVSVRTLQESRRYSSGGGPSPREISGQGSGVIMSASGYILTNNHVVEGSDRVVIGLHDRRQFTGVVVGRDDVSDLAVIKIEASDLFPAAWGDSDLLNVGSMVWAVGSPYGLEQTVTSGILSAKERGNLTDDPREYLQTDAAVNPGNSGGPLVNARGEVVGINTSIYGEQFQGISFAIPSMIARFVFEQIISEGKVTRSFLGIVPLPVTPADMSRFQLPDLNGAFVKEIRDFGPAANSPLREGDVIRRWGGNEVKTYNSLFRYVAMTRPNSTVKVDILRRGEPLTIDVAVVDLDTQADAIQRDTQRNAPRSFRQNR